MNRIALFIVAFGLSLFLPDGKLAPIELYWAIVTIITIPLWEWNIRLPVGRSGGLFLLFLMSSLLSTLYSWSLGYSVAILLRLCVAFVWFMRIKTISNKETQALVVGFAWIISIAAPISIIFFFFPHLAATASQTVLFRDSGHLPLSYLALPLIPLLYSRRTLGICRLALWAAITIVALSFSRWAIALLALLALYYGIINKQNRLHMGVVAVVLIALCVSLFSLSTHPDIVPPLLARYVVKDTITQDARVAYIREAIQGLRTSPFIGTGPGTFALISRKFADAPEHVADYTHNIVAQLFLEYGIIGTFIFTLIIMYVSARVRVQVDLFLSLMLTALLAIFETNTNQYAVLILISFAAGILIGKEKPIKKLRLVPIGMLVAIVILTLFWWGSNTRTFASFFLPKNPDVSYALAQTARTAEAKLAWYRKAIQEDPTNTSYERGYLSLLSSMDPILFCNELMRVTHVAKLNCLHPAFTTMIKNGQMGETLTWLTPSDGYTKFVYKLGLDFYKLHDDQSTILLWEKARDTAPNWSYYHLELASLVAKINKKQEMAVPALVYCLSYPATKSSCQYYLDNLNSLPAPGSWEPYIQAIPEILHKEP